MSEDVVFNAEEGWCYIDLQQDPSHNRNIVANCPAGNKRLIRFVGPNVPAEDSITYVFCDN